MPDLVQRMSYYEDRIKNLFNLPTLPIIATELIRVAREDRLSINQILPIIEKDPPLAMKVLKFANSPFYGLREKVKSLHHAIVVIGLAQLTELATAFSLIRALEGETSELTLPWKQFWEHSVATGYMAQLIAEDLSVLTTENLYSIGLLHDIGKLILYRVDPQNYYKAYLLSAEKRIPSEQAEQEIFGFSHAEAGYWISERWELPQGIINGIRFHHAPCQLSELRYRNVVALINLADHLVNFRIARFGTNLLTLKEEGVEGWKIIKERYFPDDDNIYENFLERTREQSPMIQEMAQLIRF